MKKGFMANKKLYRVISLVLVATFVLAMFTGCAAEKEKFQKSYLDAFDTAIAFIAYADSQEEFDVEAEKVHQELLKYHQLFDIYNKYEGVNNLRTVNENAGIEPVVVDEKIIDMLEVALEYYDLTDGKVNVAMGSVLVLWHNARNYGIAVPEEAELPNMDRLKEASAHMDINKVIIDRDASTVYLEDPDMALDVGAIAKGYATEMVAQMLEDDGWTEAILNVGGNIRAIGAKPDGTLWGVGVQNPDLSDTANPHSAVLEVENLSLATSGVYQRYYTVDGKNYHHIIDGTTLMPEDRYLSVSVLTPDSGIADAVSTALFNMELEEGMKFVSDHENLEAMWITPDKEVYYSEGFEDYIIE